MNKVKAAVLTAYQSPLEMREYPAIQTLEAGEALVRVEMAGICGTDVHLWKGELAVPHLVVHDVQRGVRQAERRAAAGVGEREQHGLVAFEDQIIDEPDIEQAASHAGSKGERGVRREIIQPRRGGAAGDGGDVHGERGVGAARAGERDGGVAADGVFVL